MRTLFFISMIAIALGAVPAAASPKTEARKHLDRATLHHKAGKFEDALKELEIAYALDPQPALLYAIGQVHVMQGRCERAIVFYQQFLDAAPEPGQAAKAREAVATCRKLVPEPPPRPAEPPPRPAEPPPPPPPPRAEARIVVRTSPWYTDVLGDVLVGGGVASAIASAVVFRAAHSDRDAADRAASYGAYDALLISAGNKQTMAIVLGAGGVALATAGVLSYAIRDRRVETKVVSVVPTGDGGMLSWSGRF